MDGADVRVVEGGGGARLAQEPLERSGVGRRLRRKELQGDVAAEHGVLGTIDHTHPAAAQAFHHAIMSYGLADHGKHPGQAGKLC